MTEKQEIDVVDGVDGEDESLKKEVTPKKKSAIKKKTNKKDASKKKEAINKTQKEIDVLKKKYKVELSTFANSPLSKVEFINSGDQDINEMLSGDPENGGYPRGRMIEISGPEGSGKTFLLSKLYAQCAKDGLKHLHIDAEGTYAMDFAKIHGVDPEKLTYNMDDNCEEVMRQLELYLQNNDFDVIGIDSLASLVPSRQSDSDMGKASFGPLANAMAACYPRVNSALKKSKTVLIFINQLRDNVAAAGKPWLDAEKTPGGRTTKFFATIRITARPRKPLKEERPDMFSGGRRTGHVLALKTIKNKIHEPFMEAKIDLVYRLPSKAIEIIKEAIDNDVIDRQRTKKDNSLYGKELKYHGLSFVPEVKYDPYSTCTWLRENGLLIHLFVELGYDDFDDFIEAGDLSEEDIENYLAESSVEE